MPDLKTVLSHFDAIVTEPVMVAFSGGADSVLVLKLALEASRGRVPVYALYADAPWMPRAERAEALLIKSYCAATIKNRARACRIPTKCAGSSISSCAGW